MTHDRADPRRSLRRVWQCGILTLIVRPHLATLVEDYRRHGDQRAVVLYRGNRRHVCTYKELAELAERFAAELMRRKISVGERVVLWGQNSAQWIAAFFGCVLRGVLVVPLDSSGGLDFAHRVISETQPRLIVADRALLARLENDSQTPHAIPHITLEELDAALPHPPFATPLLEPSLGPGTPLQILFTSGTTSEPKGIVHTHGNVLASLEPIEREMQKYLRYESIFHPLRFLHTLPLSHVFGQFMGLWIPPLLAAELHFETRLQAPRLMELIRRQRISVLAAVPRVLDLLKTELESRIPNLDSRIEQTHGKRVWHHWWHLRDVHRLFGFKFWALVCGGASLSPPLERFWSDLGFALIQGYGMTETAALITLNHPFHIAQGTIGKPLPGREIRIGSDGEVMVRGAMVASARWQKGEMRASPDPWLATGDLVEQDDEGQLHFLGRKSETIVTAAGLNVHPEDVEAALNSQPGVQASAVVPLETSSGPEPVAVLLFRDGARPVQSAVDAANATLADYQRVRRWMLWPQMDFPRTTIGKIQRRKITEWVAAQSAGEAATSAAADPLSEIVSAILRTPSTHFPDEARLDQLDSLARVQLQSELEQRLGITLSDEEFTRVATFGELRTRLGLRSEQTEVNVGAPTQISAGAPFKPAVSLSGAVPSPNVSAQSAPPSRYFYPRWIWWPPVHALRVVFQEMVIRPLTWLLAAPVVRREPGLVSLEQPLLLIANHVTAYDAALALYALPGNMRRRVAIAMSGEMLEDFRHGRNLGNWFLNLLGPAAYALITVLFNVFPLPRATGFRRSFDYAGEAMDRGYHVLVFPEGRRSADGTLFPFRPGIGLLARESQAQILPVALRGLGELKSQKRRWFRSGILEIRVGSPLTLDLQQAPEELAETLQKTLADLLQR